MPKEFVAPKADAKKTVQVTYDDMVAAKEKIITKVLKQMRTNKKAKVQPETATLFSLLMTKGFNELILEWFGDDIDAGKY